MAEIVRWIDDGLALNDDPGSKKLRVTFGCSATYIREKTAPPPCGNRCNGASFGGIYTFIIRMINVIDPLLTYV